MEAAEIGPLEDSRGQERRHARWATFRAKVPPPPLQAQRQPRHSGWPCFAPYLPWSSPNGKILPYLNRQYGEVVDLATGGSCAHFALSGGDDLLFARVPWQVHILVAIQ